MGFSTRNWIWILRKKIGVLTPWATSLAPSITPSVFQNHCLRTVILKCDPDGLLCETLSCGLQGQNFDSGILFALPPTLSEMPWSFPEAVWHHNLIELVTEPNIKTQVSSTKPGLERDTEVNNRLEHVRPFSVIFFFETHRSLWFGFVFVTIYMLFVLTWSGLIALLFFPSETGSQCAALAVLELTKQALNLRAFFPCLSRAEIRCTYHQAPLVIFQWSKLYQKIGTLRRYLLPSLMP